MCSDKQRVATYLQTSINEMELIEQMATPIHEPNQFGLDITGMTIFRACSMINSLRTNKISNWPPVAVAEVLRRAFSTPFAILALSVPLGVQLAAFFEIY